MFSSALLAAVLAGCLSGAGTGFFFSRRAKISLDRKFNTFQGNLLEEVDRTLEDRLEGVGPLIGQQVQLAMSEVLSAMAAAEQQKEQMMRAQAQAEELAQLRAAVQRGQAAGAGFQPPANTAQINETIAAMNSRMAAMAQQMREAGVNPVGQ